MPVSSDREAPGRVGPTWGVIRGMEARYRRHSLDRVHQTKVVGFENEEQLLLIHRTFLNSRKYRQPDVVPKRNM